LISPASGYFPNGTSVSISDAYVNPANSDTAKIYYTTNGIDPTTSDTLYSQSFFVSASAYPLVRARAFYTNSAAHYETIPSSVASVQASTTNGVFANFVGVPNNVNAGVGSTV